MRLETETVVDCKRDTQTEVRKKKEEKNIPVVGIAWSRVELLE